jgi:hypothetical protein
MKPLNIQEATMKPKMDNQKKAITLFQKSTSQSKEIS